MADQLTYGSFYFDVPAVTTLSAATAAKALGTTAPMATNGFTIGTNRLTLNGGQATRTYEATASLSSTKSSGGSTDGSFYIFKNGVEIPGGHIQRTLANTADIGAIAVNCQVELAEGDYLEVWVESTNGDNITIEHGVLAVKVTG